jgi:high affinity Mn2+ porin
MKLSPRPFAIAAALSLSWKPAFAEDAPSQVWSIHGQATFVEQFHPAFRSPYRGPNSLNPSSNGRETVDATLFLGARIWGGGEIYANPEIDQGFGLSNTVGVAGFPSGEAYKVGKASPYLRLQRLFFRQTFDLGGDIETVVSGQNQLAGTRTRDHFTITAGKFSVTDIFDGNMYAHDPKADFLNWSIIDSGAFDYAADAWGYSYGVAGEWTQDWWSLRGGLFDLSRIPNPTELVRGLGQYELVMEAEARYDILHMPGKLSLLSYYNRGRMGAYNNAVALALATNSTPDTALVRRPATRPGIALNLQQQLTDQLGGFARLSWNDGSQEAYEFTEINRSIALGLALKGGSWSRPDDTIALAGAVNDVSASARRYLAAGGVGILVGDGALPRYGREAILETYYKIALTKWLFPSLDYQFIADPAYSAERGPVSVFSLRLHAEF